MTEEIEDMEGGQAEMWGRVDNLLLIHKSLQRVNEESPDGRKNNKKSETLGVGFLFGDLGCRNPGQPYFFLSRTYLGHYLFKNYFGKKRKLEGLMYAQTKRILVKHYLFFPRENHLFRQCSIG